MQALESSRNQDDAHGNGEQRGNYASDNAVGSDSNGTTRRNGQRTPDGVAQVVSYSQLAFLRSGVVYDADEAMHSFSTSTLHFPANMHIRSYIFPAVNNELWDEHRLVKLYRKLILGY